MADGAAARAGRGGMAGNFFVIEACGAAAERGASLDDLLATLEIAVRVF